MLTNRWLRPDISCLHRAGRYLMDVAVAFSSIQPSPSEGLVSSNIFYEGFHILGSPFEVLVADTSHICDTRALPPCL